MNESRPQEFRRLLVRLCDGELSSDERRRLNELLGQDALMQYTCLDHLMIEALLERELGGSPSEPAVPWVNRSSRKPIALRPRLQATRLVWLSALVATLVLGVAVTWRPLRHWFHGVELSRSLRTWSLDEEAHSDVSSGGTSWQGDEVAVVESHLGVLPAQGTHMLRFIQSREAPEESCEIYRAVEVGKLDSLEPDEQCMVRASALVNSIAGTGLPPYAFEVSIWAVPDSPDFLAHSWPGSEQRALASSDSRFQVDADAESWQRITTTMPLPRDARYLVVKLSAIRLRPQAKLVEFPGQLLDDLTLELVCQR